MPSALGRSFLRAAALAAAVIAPVCMGPVVTAPVARAQSGDTARPAGTPAPVRVLPRDRPYLQRDAGLYAIARKYFPGDDSSAPQKRLFRLTRDQLDASVSALLPTYAPPSIKTAMARDPLQTNYEYAELLGFNAANFGALTGWIRGIAQQVKASPAALIDCAASRDSQSCLETQARRFIVKAFRGDADAAKVDRLVHFFVAGAKGVGVAQAASELVEVVLSSPDFLFRKELDVVGAGTAPRPLVKASKGPETEAGGLLAPAQLLQALTYIVADAPPEKLGLNSADARRHLQTAPEARAAIQSIVTSQAAREKLVRFFKAWLEVKEPGEFAISPKLFPEFTPELQRAMVEETDRFLRAELMKPQPRLKDITQAAHSFVSRNLDAVYAAERKDPIGAMSKRLGIFTQPAVIASHSGPTDTRLIKRGVFWTRKLMCIEMGTPAKSLDVTIYEAKTTTERKRIEQATARPACIGCHQSIDPFGYFQENFDALGRWRDKEDGKHQVDAGILIDFLDEKPASTNGPVEALEVLTGSAMFKQCFVRQLFRFYMGRQEQASDDPLLRRMFFEFADKDRQDILQAVQTLASSDRIARRQ